MRLPLRKPRPWATSSAFCSNPPMDITRLVIFIRTGPSGSPFSGFRESFRFAGESVGRGYSVLIFPEGEVNNSEDGRMAPFQSGIGLLAENLGIPIVPMRLDGVWQMKRERRRLAHVGEITVRIGKPLTFASGTPPDEIARQLEWTVKSL